MTLNATQILQKLRERNAMRQRKFYQKNKDTINSKRREIYKLGKENLKNQNDPLPEHSVEHDDNNVDEPREIITTKEEVRKAIETTEHFKNDSTRRSNKNQLSLIFRATNDEPLMNWLDSPEKAKELVENILNLKQKTEIHMLCHFHRKDLDAFLI